MTDRMDSGDAVSEGGIPGRFRHRHEGGHFIMMRSLFSGVAGLTTHQTRMDVIGNNIANVNTTAYKAQSMVFSDLLYQTTQAASGANGDTGRGGINPRQIGLGSKTGAISTAITRQGSAQSTNNPWDVMIEGDSFFVVSDGSQNFFTRDGSFTVDGAGNLVMANLGYTVMGWQVDPETGDIKQDVVSALRIMHPDNLHSDPEATTQGYVSGILDKNDPQINSTAGCIRTMTIYDGQGYPYTVKFSFHGISGNEDQFRVQLDDIQDQNGVSLVDKYGLSNIDQVATFGESGTRNTVSHVAKNQDATYDAQNNNFYVTLGLSQILEGFSANNMVVAAGDTVKVTSPANDGNVAAGADVTVSGNVTLTKAQLESAPYNLIYNEADKKYYRKADNGNTSQVIETEADWIAALQSLEGMDTVTPTMPTINEDGSVDINFTATFQTTADAQFTAASRTFGVTLDASDTSADNVKNILKQVYNIEDGDGKTYGIDYIGPDGSAQIIMTENNSGNIITFDHDTGKFSYIGSQGSNSAMLTFNTSASSLNGQIIDLTQFSNVDIDFSSVSNVGNGKKCTLEMLNGSKEDSTIGAGRKQGELIGIEIGQDGRITASYDNGLTKLLGQIAVAEFANPSGLAKAGNNLYSATQNSGEFNGVGVDITANQGQMTSGYLEMSNVDLSSEFTTMITTQRGFQANSRIITVSDTLLEELVNLKR